MNLTFGFIAFFTTVVIPGILFRRFYYFGEFSKQFDTKDPVLHSIFYSVVPGICIQLTAFIFTKNWFSFNISNVEVFSVFKDFVYSGEKDLTSNTRIFLNSNLEFFLVYSISIFIFSGFIGRAFAFFVRITKLDKRYKVLRFKNQFFYVFSGEVLEFKKFRLGKKVTLNSYIEPNNKISTTYADVMISNENGVRELYTGYIADYDLKRDDVTTLDRLYLLDAYRYKKKRKTEQERQSLENKEESRIRFKIPGDVFVINCNHIININLTYLPSDKKKKLNSDKKQFKFQLISVGYFLLVLCVILIHVVYLFIDTSESTSFIGKYMEQTNTLGKVLVWFTLSQFLRLFFPSVDHSKNYAYALDKFFLYRFCIFILLMVLSYVFIPFFGN